MRHSFSFIRLVSSHWIPQRRLSNWSLICMNRFTYPLSPDARCFWLPSELIFGCDRRQTKCVESTTKILRISIWMISDANDELARNILANFECRKQSITFTVCNLNDKGNTPVYFEIEIARVTEEKGFCINFRLTLFSSICIASTESQVNASDSRASRWQSV